MNMGQSLTAVYLHIVFSTKFRQPLIVPGVEDALNKYLGGICNSLECTPVRIGGYTDHVHILCLLSRKITIAKLVMEIKSNSSRWIKTIDSSYCNFFWQDGYGAFSVSKSAVPRTIDYIARQKQHHQKQGFQTEFIHFLTSHDISYDEKYIWE